MAFGKCSIFNKPYRNKLNEDDKQLLDREINAEEIMKVLKNIKTNKSPGEDGIISEFYI